MRFDKYTITRKNGEQVEGQIAIPETWEELLKVYPKERIFILGLAEYVTKAKKRLKSNRSPVLKLRLTDITIEQQEALRKLGLLKRY